MKVSKCQGGTINIMMFVNNKYTRWYNSIVTVSQSRTLGPDIYTEDHHIVPKCFGGSNKKENLVTLTAREHFICHWLLIKMVNEPHKRKMKLALSKMCQSSSNQQRHKITSRMYDQVRKYCSEAMTGENNPMFGKSRTLTERANISAGVRLANERDGPRTITEKHKNQISAANTGWCPSTELRAQWSKVRKGRPGQDNNSGKHWYNDGLKSYLKKECPEGCVLGRLSYS